MAPLSDPGRIAAYRDALQDWNHSGFVCFELPQPAYDWLRAELGITLKELGRLMWEYVDAGGTIDEVREIREPWCEEFEFHHDLRFVIQGRAVYVETRLHFSPPLKPDKAFITVVNIHDP